MEPSDLYYNSEQTSEALKKYQIFDSAEEKEYNEIIEIASIVCDTPMSIITFMDDRRQWFKAKKGLVFQETDITSSFCIRTMQSSDIMIVEDAVVDKEYLDNPLVTGVPHIRFYAGVPLINLKGIKLGTLAVLDTKPRKLNEQCIKALRILARQVVHLLELRHDNLILNSEIAVRTTEMSRKLEMQQELGNIIRRAQTLFIRSADSKKAFHVLLNDLLAITDSEYGFIGEVLNDQEGNPYLKTHTITNIAWNEETRKYYQENIEQGLIFSNLKTLFGEVMVTGKPVIANNPYTDPRRGGLPEGHPALNAFLGLPFGTEDRLEGMVGLSNRKAGYDNELIQFLEPLLSVLSDLIKAARSEKLRTHSETELQKQFQELQKTNHELDRFVYSASHDLRAPLASMLGLVNIAQKEILSDTVSTYLTMMRNNLNRLDGFIKDILDYSLNSRTEPKMEQISFHKIIKETLEDLTSISRFEVCNIEIRIEESIPLHSDSRRLSIILNNLISNAIKYADHRKEKCRIAITITTTDEGATLEIWDNGVGIQEHHLDKIFNMFYRASENSKGSGLGLYIVQEAVHKLGGWIKVNSHYGSYTSLKLSVPNCSREGRP